MLHTLDVREWLRKILLDGFDADERRVIREVDRAILCEDFVQTRGVARVAYCVKL
jgi:hypothetical protein